MAQESKADDKDKENEDESQLSLFDESAYQTVSVLY